MSDALEKDTLIRNFFTDNQHTSLVIDAIPKLLLNFFKTVATKGDCNKKDYINKLSRVKMLTIWKDDSFIALRKSADFEKALLAYQVKTAKGDHV